MCLFTGMICPAGLQAEGLFYRNPGPTVSHSGGLLEDGVGVEVSFNRYAHRTQREGAGTVLCLSFTSKPSFFLLGYFVILFYLFLIPDSLRTLF